MRKLTNEEFLSKVESIHGDEYTPLSEYKGARNKISVRHNKCGRIWETTPDKLYSGGCLACGYEKMKKKQRKTNEQFVNEVASLVGNEYVFLDKYINNTTKLSVKHTGCGHTYRVTPRDFLSGRRCPKCKNKRISKSVTKDHEHFLDRLGDSLNGEYELLSEYVNSRTKIEVKHLECGLVYSVNPQHLIRGKRCPECWKKENGLRFRKTHEQFIEDLGEVWFEHNELLSEYKKQTEKVDVLHKKCGNVFPVVPDSLLRGSGCPHCKMSRGEKEVVVWLTDKEIDFIPQFKFDDCFYKEKLPFDFAIVEHGEPVYLIEYQGVQHYEPVDIFGGEDSFLEQQVRDSVKRNYAQENNIPLIEIKYTQNVDEVLSKLIPR